MSILHETKHVSHGDKEAALILRPPPSISHKDFLMDAALVNTFVTLVYTSMYKRELLSVVIAETLTFL